LIANIRYGARAFSTLEGYASRNRETELAFRQDLTETRSHRRGSRLRWEEGRREAESWASVRVSGLVAGASQGSPMGLRAAV